MDEDDLRLQFEMILQLRRTATLWHASDAAVQRFLRTTLLFARNIMSEDVFRRAMRSGSSGQGLLVLANRVQQLEPLLADNWPDDFTFDDVVNDLFGIAHGDPGRVVKGDGKKGRFKNAHALLSKKLDAHGWYKVLGELKMKTPDRQALIIDRYGVSFDAFNKWRKEAKDNLDSDYVERYLESFVDLKCFAADLQPDPLAWAAEQASQAGVAYQAELHQSQA